MTGGCQCGAVGFEISGAPAALVVCHCGQCRKQSASAFGISVRVDASQLRLRRGEPRSWSRPTESGHVLRCSFCGTCGTRLWHQREGGGTLSVKGGSLDVPIDLNGAVHIFTAGKLPGVVIPAGAEQHSAAPG
ncbi:GFA family protein [Roseomonas sp. BN140053]|uniref:GFA family protein n=1 Tax=Roseomonas sp. BN140053 TaxID=3391898 RepID=UPI0039EBF564